MSQKKPKLTHRYYIYPKSICPYHIYQKFVVSPGIIRGKYGVNAPIWDFFSFRAKFKCDESASVWRKCGTSVLGSELATTQKNRCMVHTCPGHINWESFLGGNSSVRNCVIAENRKGITDTPPKKPFDTAHAHTRAREGGKTRERNN